MIVACIRTAATLSITFMSGTKEWMTAHAPNTKSLNCVFPYIPHTPKGNQTLDMSTVFSLTPLMGVYVCVYIYTHTSIFTNFLAVTMCLPHTQRSYIYISTNTNLLFLIYIVWVSNEKKHTKTRARTHAHAHDPSFGHAFCCIPHRYAYTYTHAYARTLTRTHTSLALLWGGYDE